MRIVRTTMLAAVVASVLAAGPAPAASSDPWITAKTKLALLTAEGVNPLHVNIDTVDGRVTLHGTVETDAERRKAEEVARGIDGVSAVENLIQVVPERAAETVEAADDQLKEQVAKRLDADTALEDSDVIVQSVNKGVVLLAGEATTLSDHLRAVEVAGAVPGVRRVASEIESPDEIADGEIYRELRADRPAADADDESPGFGRTATDTWVTTAVKMRLLADPDVPGLDVNVDTRQGVVTLFGAVGSAKAKADAESAARATAGVREVRNDLQVVPDAKAALVEEQDEVVDERIAAALEKDERLDEAAIDVEVTNGVARLTGTVDSQAERLTAAVVARGVPGVRAVQNDLRVSSS